MRNSLVRLMRKSTPLYPAVPGLLNAVVSSQSMSMPSKWSGRPSWATGFLTKPAICEARTGMFWFSARVLRGADGGTAECEYDFFAAGLRLADALRHAGGDGRAVHRGGDGVEAELIGRGIGEQKRDDVVRVVVVGGLLEEGAVAAVEVGDHARIGVELGNRGGCQESEQELFAWLRVSVLLPGWRSQ